MECNYEGWKWPCNRESVLVIYREKGKKMEKDSKEGKKQEAGFKFVNELRGYVSVVVRLQHFRGTLKISAHKTETVGRAGETNMFFCILAELSLWIALLSHEQLRETWTIKGKLQMPGLSASSLSLLSCAGTIHTTHTHMHRKKKKRKADLSRVPWGSFRHFPAEAWRLREARPEGTSSITDCELLPAVCPDQPLSESSYFLSLQSPLYRITWTVWPHYHTALSAILKCPQFPGDGESNSNNPNPKKQSSCMHLSERWFSSPLALWVGRWVRGMPWKCTRSRHVLEGSQRNIWALRWMALLNAESLGCCSLQQDMWPARTCCQVKECPR